MLRVSCLNVENPENQADQFLWQGTFVKMVLRSKFAFWVKMSKRLNFKNP
jgi:hypothetical protein